MLLKIVSSNEGTKLPPTYTRIYNHLFCFQLNIIILLGVNIMEKRLNPKNFVNYKTNEKDISNKLFLYQDREINTKVTEISYEGEKYEILVEDPINLDLPGQVTDADRSISRSLFNSYEWSLLKASFCDGYFFCYIDFITGSDSEAKQLTFKVYKLKKID